MKIRLEGSLVEYCIDDAQYELVELEWWNSCPDWMYTRSEKSRFVQDRNRLKQKIRKLNLDN